MANGTSTSNTNSISNKDKTKVEKKNGKWVAEGIDGQMLKILMDGGHNEAKAQAIIDAVKLIQV